jgi:hypothetical protein
MVGAMFDFHPIWTDSELGLKCRGDERLRDVASLLKI